MTLLQASPRLGLVRLLLQVMGKHRSAMKNAMETQCPSRFCSREPLCPALPPEVWINIFRYHTNLAHLWIVCRRVSPVLRACAEYAFGEYFLRDVHVDFQLEKHNLGGNSKRPEVPVRFDRLGIHNKKDIARYKDGRSEGIICEGQGKKRQGHFEMVMNRWEENVRDWKPEMPNYTIRIGDLVNDTALPGLGIDIARREIYFEWKEMLRLFFREHKRLEELKEEWRLDAARILQTSNSRLAQGEELSPTDFPPPWSAVEFEIRKDIRRTRLKENYIGNDEMTWAINSLKCFEEYGAITGTMKALKLNVDLPGAGLGGKWFGSAHLVQELYLDEWSCMHRIDTKLEHLRGER